MFLTLKFLDMKALYKPCYKLARKDLGWETEAPERQRCLQVSIILKPDNDNCVGRGFTGPHAPVHFLAPKSRCEGWRGVVVSIDLTPSLSSSVTEFWRAKESQEKNFYQLPLILQSQNTWHKYGDHNIRQHSRLAEREVTPGCLCFIQAFNRHSQVSKAASSAGSGQIHLLWPILFPFLGCCWGFLESWLRCVSALALQLSYSNCCLHLLRAELQHNEQLWLIWDVDVGTHWLWSWLI